MNLIEFHEKYAKARSHDKIKIRCDMCGEKFEVLKTRAQQTIAKRGMYIDRSCGQRLKHARKPVTNKTKNKIAKGVHESRFKKLIADLENHITMDKVLDWDVMMEANWEGGILWTVEKMSTGEKVIIANIFDWYPSVKSWCFKEISEMEGLVAINCPTRFLRKAPVIHESWRKRVRKYNRQVKDDKPPAPQIIEEWISSQ